MRKPLAKVAKTLLTPLSKPKRLLLQRHQSVSAQASPRILHPEEDYGVNGEGRGGGDKDGTRFKPLLEHDDHLDPLVSSPQRSQTTFSTNVQELVLNPWRNQVLPRDTIAKPLQDNVRSRRRKESKPYEAIPSPKGLPLIGTLIEFLRAGGISNLHEYNRNRHLQFGPIYKEMTAGTDAVFVGTPELFKEVYANEGPMPKSFTMRPVTQYSETKPVYGLFIMDGEKWHETRKGVNQVLIKPVGTGVMGEMLTAYEGYLEEYVGSWNDKFREGKQINLERECYMLAYDGLAFAAFGENYRDVKRRGDFPAEKFSDALIAAARTTNQLTDIPFDLGKKLNLKVWQEFAASMDYIQDASYKIAQRAIQKESSKCPMKGLQRGGLLHRLQTETELPSELVHNFAAGILGSADPFAVTLMWYVGCVASQPEVQSKIRSEIQQVCGDSPVSYRHLEHLQTLKNTLKEAQRLFPVAPFVTRQVVKPCVVGGYEIPAEKWLIISNYATQRNPEYFPDPFKFWPERWQRKEAGELNGGAPNLLGVTEPRAFTPFGGGKRACVARILAKSLQHLLVGRLVQNFELEAELPDPVVRTILVPKQDIKLSIRPLS